MTGPLDEQLAECRRECAQAQMTASAARSEADRCIAGRKRLEAERDGLALRISELLSMNAELYSFLTNIINAAESSGSYAEIAGSARKARSRLPKEGL